MKDVSELARRAGLARKQRILTNDDREGFYKTVFNRRDVRGQFLLDPVPDATLARVLTAAHHAPSVGFMQPWNFLIIKSRPIRQRVHRGFLEANQAAEKLFTEERRATYRGLKLEGILEAPLNICVTCERGRSGPVVLGATAQPNMDLYSTVCAVQNLWLAARSEGLGVGWVSIIAEETLREILDLPEGVVPVAYLCLGYVSHFKKSPELEQRGWRSRVPLEDLVYFDQWQGEEPEMSDLLESIRDSNGW